MKTKLYSVVLMVSEAFASVVQANEDENEPDNGNEDECGIWMCLPFAFALPGCSGPRSAMIDRLWEGKGPAPSFGKCSVQSENTPTLNPHEMFYGSAALMGSYIENGQWVRPESLIMDGIVCNHRDTGEREPRGCLATLKSIKQLENGVQKGLTYYRNNFPGSSDLVRDPKTGEIYKADEVPQDVIESAYQ